jgi:hypothetical protein
VIELVGTSSRSWEDAARSALATAKSLKDLRVAEVTKRDIVVDDKGEAGRFRTKLNVSFKVRP